MCPQEQNNCKIIARNKKAFHDYEIFEKIEAGIELRGAEVKSLRAGRINLSDCYALNQDGQLFVHHMHISPFEQANRFNQDPYRKRRLLLHRGEILKLSQQMEKKHLSLIPLSVYFKKQWVKVELGLCKGKRKYDKRQKIAAEESKKNLRTIIRAASAHLLAMALLLSMPARAAFTFVAAAGSAAGSVPSVRLAQGEHISIPHLCERLGMHWEWDWDTEKLTCSGPAVRIVFTQDNTFYTVNDSLFQMPLPPMRVGGNLYCAACVVRQAFAAAGVEVEIDEDAREIRAGKASAAGVSAAVSSVGDSTPAQPKKNNAPAVAKRAAAQAFRTIVIDPGHGGRDPGAIGPGGTMEKDVVLAIALKLRDLLKKEQSLEVFLTRETDVFVPLVKRTEFANKKNADIFISIHANSIQGSQNKRTQVKGFKIYFLSQAKNEEDKLVAMMENAVTELEGEGAKGDYLQNILVDMANNEYMAESENMSIMLAESFRGHVQEITSLHEGVGQAPFWVLNGAFMPSVLIETAFISNPAEEKLLGDGRFQRRIAAAICSAVIRFKEKYGKEL